MPYSYNKAIIDHPDMKEFLEGQWMAHLRYIQRVAELEAALREIADTWCPDSRDEYELRGQDMRSSARMQSIARAALTKSETR